MFLKTSNLRRVLSSDNSPLLRNPATGLSIAANTVQAGVQVLDQLRFEHVAGLDDFGASDLAKLFNAPESRAFQDAIFLLNTNGHAKDLDPEELKRAFATVQKFFKDNHEILNTTLPNLAIASSRLYLLAMRGT